MGEGSQWQGKRWYAYGTSMTSDERGFYARCLEQLSGLTLINRGAPGCGITEGIGAGSPRAEVRYRAMDPDDGKKEADLITLEVGPNDRGATLGSIYDSGTDSFCGCLNQIIRFLQAETNAQIVVMSMTGGRWSSQDPSKRLLPEERKAAPAGEPYTRFEMNCAIRDVSALNGVYYIPVAESCGLSPARMGLDERYVSDNIHHRPAGGWNVAQFIWSRLKDIPLWYTEAPKQNP